MVEEVGRGDEAGGIHFGLEDSGFYLASDVEVKRFIAEFWWENFWIFSDYFFHSSPILLGLLLGLEESLDLAIILKHFKFLVSPFL